MRRSSPAVAAVSGLAVGAKARFGATRVKLRATAADQVAAVAQTFTENVVFLPTSVADSVAQFRGVFAAITASAEFKEMYPPQLYESADP